MLTSEFANHFAQEWVEAWNAHDLERILSHYTDDFQMTSPLIVSLMGIPEGTIKGKAGVGDYWGKALARNPNLHFELKAVTFSLNSIALYYENTDRKSHTIEWFLFNSDGKCVQSIGHYEHV